MILASSAMGADLQQLAFVALMNPAAILTGFFIGRYSDQWQKIVVGGFAAGFTGLAFVWLIAKFGIYVGNTNSVGGIFAASFVVGMVWCLVGYMTRKKAT